MSSSRPAPKTLAQLHSDDIPATECMVCRGTFRSRNSLANHRHDIPARERTEKNKQNNKLRCKDCRARQRRMQPNCPQHLKPKVEEAA